MTVQFPEENKLVEFVRYKNVDADGVMYPTDDEKKPRLWFFRAKPVETMMEFPVLDKSIAEVLPVKATVSHGALLVQDVDKDPNAPLPTMCKQLNSKNKHHKLGQ